MRVFTTRRFSRFARNEGIGDWALCEAIDRAERGLIDADLGTSLIKQRVARPGQGRRGGHRTIIAYRAEKRAIFLHGFPKSAQENVAPDELRAMKAAAAELLGACPSSRARSKIEESFSLRPFSRPPSLVLRSTTGAIRGRCEEAVLGRIESHSLLFNRVALLGHTPRKRM